MTTDDQAVDQNPDRKPEEELEDVQNSADESTLNGGTEGAQAQTAPDDAADEAAALRDQLLRAHAEMQNLRRRLEKDVESAHKFGQEKLIKELLPVIDNLERAIESASPEELKANPVLEGVHMTLGLFTAALGKSEVVAVDPVGEPFDPQLHQAMSMVENPEVEPNTVIAVMQKGYTLAGRLIRPAMVMVSKGGVSAGSIDEKA